MSDAFALEDAIFEDSYLLDVRLEGARVVLRLSLRYVEGWQCVDVVFDDAVESWWVDLRGSRHSLSHFLETAPRVGGTDEEEPDFGGLDGFAVRGTAWSFYGEWGEIVVRGFGCRRPCREASRGAPMPT